MPLTTNQRKSYWARVRAAWRTQCDLGDRHLTIEEFRAELHHDAGVPASTGDFRHRDLDAVFARLSIYEVIGGTARPVSRRDQDEQTRRRLLYVIDSIGLPSPYIERIARDKFATADWRRLDDPSLRQLLYTLQARDRSRRQLNNAAAR